MARINTHGLKIIGLKKASGGTCKWSGHTEIWYDMSTGECWTVDHANGNWGEYHDPDYIKVWDVSRHVTMQEIADKIDNALYWHKVVNARQ